MNLFAHNMEVLKYHMATNLWAHDQLQGSYCRTASGWHAATMQRLSSMPVVPFVGSRLEAVFSRPEPVGTGELLQHAEPLAEHCVCAVLSFGTYCGSTRICVFLIMRLSRENSTWARCSS